jgi:glycosyltransferase involved in cell wall biosynthesis
MRVSHLSFSSAGGAGRVAQELSRLQTQLGIESKLVTRSAASLAQAPFQHPIVTGLAAFDAVISNHAKPTLFTHFRDFAYTKSVKSLANTDILHLHWTPGLINSNNLVTLGKLNPGLRVVWTLHDMWPFTGGCHYSAGCDRYTSSCHDCPQIIGEGTRLSTDWMEAKRFMLNRKDMTVTAPSKWLAGEASKSSVFRNARVEALPNTIDVNRFTPADSEERVALRKRLGLMQDELVAVVISQNFEEQRKGYSVLLDALEDLNRCGDLDGKKLTLLCVGFNGDGLEVPGVRVIATGTLENDKQMRDVLAAADFAIQCALEENYSNVILETMACGLPVLASTAGGNGEMVADRINGWLYPVETGALGLARSLKEGVFASTFDEMRHAARATACDHDSSKINGEAADGRHRVRYGNHGHGAVV